MGVHHVGVDTVHVGCGHLLGRFHLPVQKCSQMGKEATTLPEHESKPSNCSWHDVLCLLLCSIRRTMRFLCPQTFESMSSQLTTVVSTYYSVVLSCVISTYYSVVLSCVSA